MPQKDLAEAGLPYRTAIGKRTLHAFRNAFISQLWDLGIAGTQVQRLARHSDIKLTASYARRLNDSDQEAVNRLPFEIVESR